MSRRSRFQQVSVSLTGAWSRRGSRRGSVAHAGMKTDKHFSRQSSFQQVSVVSRQSQEPGVCQRRGSVARASPLLHTALESCRLWDVCAPHQSKNVALLQRSRASPLWEGPR